MTLSIKQQLLLMNQYYGYHDCWNYWQCYRQHASCLSQLSYNQLNAMLQLLHQRGFLSTYHEILNVDSHTLDKWLQTSIMIGETNYPLYWYHIPKPPLIIYFQGHLSVLKKPTVSIIGTRNISPYGIDICRDITQAIVEKDWVTVSGMAKGVDAFVHRTSLDTANQSTIAIIPNGFDITYPACNREIKDSIIRQGLLLSEYHSSTPVRKFQFIMRNRLVAGISPVTLIIEAAQRSGSLITANYALQYNREVMALPGPINSATSQGCHELIYQGARPIISIPQLIEDLECIFDNRLI